MIKYVLKNKITNEYVVDVEWDGTTWSKEPYFFKFYSFDTFKEANHLKLPNTTVVAIQEVIDSKPNHDPFKYHRTPKGKFTVRCSRCFLGTKNPRPSLAIAIEEYQRVTTENQCEVIWFKEVPMPTQV